MPAINSAMLNNKKALPSHNGTKRLYDLPWFHPIFALLVCSQPPPRPGGVEAGNALWLTGNGVRTCTFGPDQAGLYRYRLARGIHSLAVGALAAVALPLCLPR